jgi:branched-chain amino acid transport system ATP-binding protein
MLLEVSDVTKRFGGLTAVNSVSFRVRQGEIVGLIGPNGAGKTTLFNCIAGVFKPNSGEVRLRGQKISGVRPSSVCRSGVGRTFQVAKPFPGLTVEEAVTVGALNRGEGLKSAKASAREVLERVELSHKAGRRGKDLTLVERKRLELARALATRPEILLLDEVVAGLTPAEVEVLIGIVRKINEEGVTVLMVEHVLHAVFALSDRMVVLNYGEKIAEGTPSEIERDPRVNDAYLGGEVSRAAD